MSALAAELCAGNNALWCDAVCRAHDIPGEFHPALWRNRHTVPPFYSNAVTLRLDAETEQMALIRELAGERAAFSVKDSFARLDLRSLGFAILFEAMWLWRDAGHPAPPDPSGLVWSVVDDAARLAAWEAAWAGLHTGQAVPEADRVFRPAILAEPGLSLLAGERDGRIAAVAAANLTGQVVGVSNVFAPAAEAAACWAGVVAFVARLHPGQALVGYERGDDLAHALAVGFQTIAPLQVWTTISCCTLVFHS